MLLRPALAAPHAATDDSHQHSSAEGAHSLACAAGGGHFGSFRSGAKFIDQAFWCTHVSDLRASAGQRVCPRSPPPRSLLSEVMRIALITSDSVQCSFSGHAVGVTEASSAACRPSLLLAPARAPHSARHSVKVPRASSEPPV